jgi:hypothetical protein
MALQDKLKKSAQKVLDLGEQVQAVIATQTFHPAVQLFGILWVFVMGGRYRMVVATDRRIALVKTKVTSYRHAVGVLASLPRSMELGPVGGRPASLTINGQRLYIIAGTKKFVEVADQLRPAVT